MPGDPVTTKESIVAACRNEYDHYSDDCSGFLKAVASDLGYQLTGTANALVDYFDKNWKPIDRAEAITLAQQGVFVVAGLKGGDHNPPRNNGHVVVVVDGPLYHGKYPRVWGGSIGSAQSPGTKTVGEVWSRADRDSVQYYRPPVRPQPH